MIRKLVVNLKRIRLDKRMVPIHLIQMEQIKDRVIVEVFRLLEDMLIVGIKEPVLQTLLVNRLQKLLAVPSLKPLVVPYLKRLDKPWALQVVLT